MVAPTKTICIYCGRAISITAKGEGAPSVEHVIGWSLGGALTIPAHKRCNGRANQLVDSELNALSDLGGYVANLAFARGLAAMYIVRSGTHPEDFAPSCSGRTKVCGPS